MPLVDQQQTRFRRALINIFSDTNEKKVSANHGGTINMDSTHSNTSIKEADHWLSMIKNQGGHIMQGGTDLVLTPISWLTTITNNWPVYLVCITIILSLLAFFYCSFKACINKNLLKNSIPIPLAHLFK
ncbi:unnamed protein product [Rotaria sp. Silwood2]|nr:unnamed protein product [Rotaria sp. Silwood2]CAF3017249.1 unnamed protein product [Rotaria sp. Silwood2]CAF3277204.1 unnamed protein product [Rotaria sp. Silwood2]CAF3353239.1 unnamed protein product [Rotaria sp. Silwood2]CAF4011072.1 unnamed protein product [Rotaria sp. Silwood2]